MPRKGQFEDPTFDGLPPGAGAVPYEPEEEIPTTKVAIALKKHTPQLMAIPGVKSVGEGRGRVGDLAIDVGIANASVAKLLPKSVAGIDVITHVVGEVDAYGSVKDTFRDR